jgi:hypothetical protein
MSASLTLQRPTFDAPTAWGIALLALMMMSAWVYLLSKQTHRQAVWATLVFAIVVIANLAGDRWGLFTRLDLLPTPFVVMLMLCFGLVITVGMGYWGNIGNTLTRALTIEGLIALQIFRLPLELLLLRAANLGIMPVEFSLRGYNGDVLTGVGALLLCLYIARAKTVPLIAVWVWNVWGIFCLLVIGLLAALTSPNLHAFGKQAQHINSWVLYFPYSLLPSVLVSLAVFGQVLLTRKLLSDAHDVPRMHSIHQSET